jgi:hypothetical protein
MTFSLRETPILIVYSGGKPEFAGRYTPEMPVAAASPVAEGDDFMLFALPGIYELTNAGACAWVWYEEASGKLGDMLGVGGGCGGGAGGSGGGSGGGGPYTVTHDDPDDGKVTVKDDTSGESFVIDMNQVSIDFSDPSVISQIIDGLKSSTDTLVIEDAFGDPRFRALPL